MTKRNILLVLLIVMSLLVSSFIFISCDKNTEEPQIQEEPQQEAHEHEYSETWYVDEDYHWHESICSCDRHKIDYEKHTWDEGEVIKEPTDKEEGEIKYTCTACYYRKTVTTEKLDANKLYTTLYNNIPRTIDDIVGNTTMTLFETEKVTHSFNFDNSERTDTEKEEITNSYSNIDIRRKAIHAYSEDNGGEAYDIKYDIENGEFTPTGVAFYFFQDNGKYYMLDEYSEGAQYVSDGHDQYSVLTAINNKAEDITSAPKDYSGFNAYLCDDLAEGGIVLNAEDIIKSFVKENDKYKFLVQFTITYKGIEVEYNMEIVFTEDKLESIKMSQKKSSSKKELDPVGEGYTIVSGVTENITTIEFSIDFDETLMKKDLSSVGAVNNYRVTAYNMINGAVFTSNNVEGGTGYTPNSNALSLSSLTWYLDEECTIEVTGPITCNSYENIYVYAKLDSVPTGYAEVITLGPNANFPVINWMQGGNEVSVYSSRIAYVYKDGETEPSIKTENFTVEAGHKYYIEFKYNR